MGERTTKLSRNTLPWAIALVAAGCAAPRGEGPPIARLSPEEAARIGLTYPKPVTLDEVVALTRAKTAPEEIVRRMQQSGSVYRLTPQEVQGLRDAGVAQSVIDHMTAQQRAEAERRQRAADEEALRRRYNDPFYWPYGPHYPPYYGPYWGPSVSLGLLRRHSPRFGYGLSWGLPWGPWW